MVEIPNEPGAIDKILEQDDKVALVLIMRGFHGLVSSEAEDGNMLTYRKDSDDITDDDMGWLQEQVRLGLVEMRGEDGVTYVTVMV